MTPHSTAPSTIAMSAYSVTALVGPCTITELMNAFEVHQMPCALEPLAEALDLALIRGVMIKLPEEKFVAAGPPGWVASSRDPGDETGWSGWVCKNLKTGKSKLLAELMQQGDAP